jgi:putative FmdB family regulatory protein
MPMYDYQCQECGHTFEVRATISQKTAGLKPECPTCHSDATQQLISSAMFIRSGGGGEARPMPMGCGPNMGPGCC